MGGFYGEYGEGGPDERWLLLTVVMPLAAPKRQAPDDGGGLYKETVTVVTPLADWTLNWQDRSLSIVKIERS